MIEFSREKVNRMGNNFKESYTQYLLVIRILLLCGVASSVLYAATDMLAAMQWEDYDWTARMVSDLLSVSAPTRSFIFVPLIVYNVLVFALGTGVWMRRRNRAIGVTGIILMVYAVVSMLGLLVFPLNYDAEGANATMHMVVTFAIIILMFMFVGFAAFGSGRSFRVYSIITVMLIIGGATLAGMQIPRIEADLTTPGLGVFERLSIYAMLLWVIVFALSLWPSNKQ